MISECICIHLKSDVEKFYLLCLMTRKLFTFAKQECMEENPDSIVCQEVLTPGQLYLMFLKARIFNIFLSFFCLCPFSFAEQDCSSISAAPLRQIICLHLTRLLTSFTAALYMSSFTTFMFLFCGLLLVFLPDCSISTVSVG